MQTTEGTSTCIYVHFSPFVLFSLQDNLTVFKYTVYRINDFHFTYNCTEDYACSCILYQIKSNQIKLKSNMLLYMYVYMCVLARFKMHLNKVWTRFEQDREKIIIFGGYFSTLPAWTFQFFFCIELFGIFFGLFWVFRGLFCPEPPYIFFTGTRFAFEVRNSLVAIQLKFLKHFIEFV